MMKRCERSAPSTREPERRIYQQLRSYLRPSRLGARKRGPPERLATYTNDNPAHPVGWSEQSSVFVSKCCSSFIEVNIPNLGALPVDTLVLERLLPARRQGFLQSCAAQIRPTLRYHHSLSRQHTKCFS